MFAKRRKAHKKDTLASVSVNCQILAARSEKAREITGKEEDNVSHATDLHVHNVVDQCVRLRRTINNKNRTNGTYIDPDQ